LKTYQKKTNFYLIRKALEKDERFSISNSDFVGVCHQHGISEIEANKLLKSFDESGVFIQEKNNVVIKPNLVYKKFYETVGAVDENVEKKQQETEEIEEKLKSLEVIKSGIDAKAKKTINAVAWLSTMYLTAQMGTLMHMTWVDYGMFHVFI
jgi:hypothetical protein